ncbi:hypothetical protein MNBD_GAMMA10-426 [hydrothermal vent metagenome]|uniref:PBP domain-containing protein n=1 Tax=hydrothermal vent metagenome TaxID=652676 RepID=A0A3B0X6E4_9ZZZZ
MKITFKFKVLCKVHFFSLAAVFLMGLCWQSSVLAEVAVIAHPSASISSIDAATLRSIYMGKLKLWPDGSILTVVDQGAGSKIRIRFIDEIIGKTERKFDAYWSRKAFSGKGVLLKKPGNGVDVKIWVSKYKGSIGYIDSSMVDASVKVLMTIK